MVSRLKEAERELDKFKKASLADNVDQIIGAPTQIGEGLCGYSRHPAEQVAGICAKSFNGQARRLARTFPVLG